MKHRFTINDCHQVSAGSEEIFFFDAFRYVGTQAVVRVPFSWLVENVKLHRSTRPISSCVANYLLPPPTRFLSMESAVGNDVITRKPFHVDLPW